MRADYFESINIQRVTITDSFWREKMELVRTRMLPYQWEVLNDRMPGAPKSYCIHNFRAAAKRIKEQSEGRSENGTKYTFRGFEVLPDDPEHPKEEFYGYVFQDSDLYKWIEAAAYALHVHPDPELERTVDTAVDLICSAQMEDGYLDTYYILSGIDGRFTNIKDHHELYCFGHLAESAAAYYEATGKRKLLDAACRYGDLIDRCFGREDGKRRGYPGHEIAEMALARLYAVTGEERYRKLGSYMIDERGARPYYFDSEMESEKTAVRDDGERYQYYQAHRPVREMDEAVGHAVRAVYLCSGMADFARINMDESLAKACEKLWEDITGRKMYITGGIGATRFGESFSLPWHLPNDLAYAETCASVGMAFFARRMLQMEAKSGYADVLELELFNTVLSGMNLDGESFFYVNPLESVPELTQIEELMHVKPVRQKWFGCACCPPNLARLIMSLGDYVCTRQGNTLMINLYTGYETEFPAEGGSLQIHLESAFPYSGEVTVSVSGSSECENTLAFRLPGWCDQPEILLPEGTKQEVSEGYLYLTRVWKEDEVRLTFPMTVRVMQADPRVREDLGKAAVMRGPLCYCAEEADNGRDLHLLKLFPDTKWREESLSIAGERVVGLLGEGERIVPSSRESLYRRYAPYCTSETTITMIPYYSWANREMGEMYVWLHTVDNRDTKKSV